MVVIVVVLKITDLVENEPMLMNRRRPGRAKSLAS